MRRFHTPVMLNEVLNYLNVQDNSWYIDCNLGGGGHTNGILSKRGNVLGIDLDPQSIMEVANIYGLKLQKSDGRLHAVTDNLILQQANFVELSNIVGKFNIDNIQGVLFDLGVSSYQLETSDRGFSFISDAPLDMRMGSMGVSAADLVTGLHEKELAELFWKYGEERFSRQIAKKIVEERTKRKIANTNELVQIILSVKRRVERDKTHPATRVFQALRIAVNDELNSLNKVLPQALEILEPCGKIVVISFHSLEDRIVKNFFREEQQNGSVKIITQKPIIPTKQELTSNPRSRSGKLRAAEKI